MQNKNVCANMLRSKFYVCPVCGNVIYSVGELSAICCGVELSACEAKALDENHNLTIEQVEDEHFVSVHHDMTKEHFISFLAYVTCDKIQLVKLYPEGNAETRFNFRGMGYLYVYCNKHGLFKIKV